MSTRTRIVGVLLVASLVASCEGGPLVTDPAPVPGAADPGPTTSPTLRPEVRRASFAHQGSTLDVAVPAVAVVGDLAVTTLEVSLPDSAQDEVSLGFLLVDDVTESKGARGVRLVERETRTVLPVVRSQGRSWSSRGAIVVSPGKSVTLHSIHRAPAVATVDVLLPSIGVVTGVPVVAAETVPAGLDDDLLPLPEGSGSAYGLREYRAAYDATRSTAVEGEDVTVTLTTDVLFASDAYELSDEASAVIAEVGSAVRAQHRAGELVVAGHTDDVDTHEYNQGLSERRAESVSAALGALLGDGYDITTVGYGETRPVLDGTTDGARAANRRVEISFSGTRSTEPRDGPSSAAPSAADVPTSPDGGPVEVVTATGSTTYRIRPVSFVRTEVGLVGMLELELVEGRGSRPVDAVFGVYGQGRSAGRGFDPTSTVVGVHELTLLGATERLYPLDYEVGEDEGAGTRRLLGDELLVHGPRTTGDVLTVTGYWPDPGGDAVTLDAPGRFRIENVPVVEEDA